VIQDLRYHGEESPTVKPEEGLFRGDQTVEYLRGPRSITGVVSILGIGWVCVVQESVPAGTVDPAPGSVVFGENGKGWQWRWRRVEWRGWTK